MEFGIRAQRASVTLATLCLSTVIAIALGSYLALCHNSYSASTRQIHSDQARDLTQVGLEEALWALNQNDWTSSGPNSNSSWTTSGANRTVTLAYSSLSQGASGQVALTVANYASTGPTWPTITVAATVTLADGSTSAKTIQSTTTPAPLFANAISSSNSYVSFVSGGTVDSWNSDPDNNPATAIVPYSFTAGNSANYAAVVSGVDDGTYGVVLNQARVNGYVSTAGKPISFSTSGSPNGMVQGPSTAGTVKVDPARVGKSAFIPASSVFSVTTPPGTGSGSSGLLADLLGLVGSILGAPASVDNFYINGDLTVDSGLVILGITIIPNTLTIDNRAAKLVVNGNLTITGSGKIVVNPNASLQIFVAGDVSIGGNGIQNLTLDPKKLAIYSTSTSTSDSIQYTTTHDFYGTIYSENKPIDIRQNANFYGALLSSQFVRFSTSATAPNFHYDTSLRNVRFANVNTPYLVGQVTEP